MYLWYSTNGTVPVELLPWNARSPAVYHSRFSAATKYNSVSRKIFLSPENRITELHRACKDSHQGKSSPAKMDQTSEVATNISPSSTNGNPVAPTTHDQNSARGTNSRPFMALAEQVAKTPLVQRVEKNIPVQARPAVSRATGVTRNVLSNLDNAVTAAKGTLETEEGKQLVSASCTFFKSFTAFVAMLYSAALDAAEPKLGIDKSDGDGLSTRTVRMGRCVFSKISSRLEKREREVEGTGESVIYRQIKFAFGVLLSFGAALLNTLAAFSGPGHEFIASTAESTISSFPDDMQKSIREQGDLSSLMERARNRCRDSDVPRNGQHEE